MAALGRKLVTPEGQPLLQQVEHQGMERHQPVLGALARHQHQPPLHVHIRHQQVADLRDAQARRIEHLQQAAVTAAALFAHVRQLQQTVHLGLAQDFRQVLGQTRAFQQAGGVALQQAFFHRVLEKAPQCRQTPGQRAARILPGPQPGQVQKQIMLVEAGLVPGVQFLKKKEKFSRSCRYETTVRMERPRWASRYSPQAGICFFRIRRERSVASGNTLFSVMSSC